MLTSVKSKPSTKPLSTSPDCPAMGIEAHGADVEPVRVDFTSDSRTGKPQIVFGLSAVRQRRRRLVGLIVRRSARPTAIRPTSTTSASASNVNVLTSAR